MRVARTSRPILAAIAAGAALALTLTACNAGSSTQSASSAGTGGASTSDAITIGLVLEPVSLDFTKADGAAIPQVVLTNIYQTLVKLDQDGKIVPSLAKDWTVSPDRLTYTFNLVDNATFTNGVKFTAKDAVFSINNVKNWTPTIKAKMADVASATAVSDTQLVVKLAKPSNEWLYSMTSRVGAMMTESGMADLANKPVGTGPYTLGSWTRGDSIVLQANPNYWGTAPTYKTVTFKYFKDPTALNNALLSGGINVIGTVQAPESLKQFQGNSKYQVISGTTNGEVVLSLNGAKAPFNNLQARQAVRYAIDHKALVDTCWAGQGTLIGSMVPPTDPWYEDRTGDYPYDVAKAKALLAQSGQAATTIQLKVPNVPYAVNCGQVVKSQLEQAGFTVNMTAPLEFPQWLQVVFKDGDYNMSIVAHVESHDLGTVFGNPGYYTHFQGAATVADLVAKADAGSTDEQIADMKAAAKYISEQAAADFLFLLPNLIVADKGITGLPKNAVGESFDLSQLSHS